VNAQSFLHRLQEQRFFAGQILHVQELTERPAAYGELTDPLLPAVRAALAGQGIERLYAHQAASIELIRQGKSVVIVTGTASGKTLCYTIPVMEALVQDERATMLFVYPTKALAQDQLRALTSFQSADEQSGLSFLGGTYDGDTPQNLRRKIRDGGSIVLTNPDMLHQGILPQHARWNRFFTNLKYVVIDEVHAYRGVFGSHLANVMRRLGRIWRHYGADPQFICSSATIANPREHAERICGVPVELVENDGSPRGPKKLVLWNPPLLSGEDRGKTDDWRVGGDRRGSLREAVELMNHLLQEGIQTIAFVRTRLAAELILKDLRDRLGKVSRKLATSVQAYRGGYLPEERREIERKLASKEVLGVASTNALELGIDIGSLEACILVGYPGTVASLWQQAGRAGRGLEDSIVFLVAQNSPMDQYLMAHVDYLFAQNPEHAVVDPDNPHISVGHLRCASQELPLDGGETEAFGPYSEAIMELLEEDDVVRRIDDRWYWASSEYPSANVSLRNIAGPVYTIQEGEEGRVVGTMDEISAMTQLHDHAVYLHGPDMYFVNRLDMQEKIALVAPRDLDYFTQAVTTSQIQVEEKDEEKPWRRGLLGYGDVTVTTAIPMFKKVRFHSRESLGFEDLDLPPQILETVSLWWAPPEEVVAAMAAKQILVGEALVGVANVIVEVAPSLVMCDTQDIGAVVDARNLGRDALFLHDRFPGGMGYARRCLDRFGDLLETVAEVIRECSCEDGCPSCVGSAVPPFAMTDIDASVRGRIPDKAGARFLLDRLVEPDPDEAGGGETQGGSS